jgi:hypothetical protein
MLNMRSIPRSATFAEVAYVIRHRAGAYWKYANTTQLRDGRVTMNEDTSRHHEASYFQNVRTDVIDAMTEDELVAVANDAGPIAVVEYARLVLKRRRA